jgi:uncharacterized membrane protein
MADYRFVTTHEIRAPMEQVWDALRDFARYPTWQKHIVQAQLIESGGPDGVGDKTRLKVKGRLPFTLTIDIIVTQADPPRTLEVRSLGGTGRSRALHAQPAPGDDHRALYLGRPHDQAVDESARAARPTVLRAKP